MSTRSRSLSPTRKGARKEGAASPVSPASSSAAPTSDAASLDVALHWFRKDLRLADNPALTEACKSANVIGVYIYDNQSSASSPQDATPLGTASKVWLHHSLNSLSQRLKGSLHVRCGDAGEQLLALVKENNVRKVVFNRSYDPAEQVQDEAIAKALKIAGVHVKTFNGSLLFEPGLVTKADGTAYKVFTPFSRACNENLRHLRAVCPPPLDLAKRLIPIPSGSPAANDAIASLGLLPPANQGGWEKTVIDGWTISEAGAIQRLTAFVSQGDCKRYGVARDTPSVKGTSGLSPYLAFGQISPTQIWATVTAQVKVREDREPFLRQLVWREFSYVCLKEHPDMQWRNVASKFDSFSWKPNEAHLKAWQTGKTGYPIVDAGMRELYQTGTMHNRLRMIVASFLVKNLMIHWHEGEKWFWDTLFDADKANNSSGWQWVAGCGFDAAPYFRIFNPVTQGQRFDPEGEYIKKYVPELKNVPKTYVFEPWAAPKGVLSAAGVTLGVNYPKPIVNVKESREAALDAFKKIGNPDAKQQ